MHHVLNPRSKLLNHSSRSDDEVGDVSLDHAGWDVSEFSLQIIQCARVVGIDPLFDIPLREKSRGLRSGEYGGQTSSVESGLCM